MKLYPISAIRIAENRQRQEFEPEALEELRNSIEARGLLHAPVIREEGGLPVLVAGERRLKVIEDMHSLGMVLRYNNQLVPEGMVPTVTLGDLDVLEAEEAELDENLKRRDLTWQELAAAHSRLHLLRTAQKNKVHDDMVRAGDTDANFIPIQTIADTAKELHGRSDGWFGDTVRKEVIVARHLTNPDVAKAKTLDEAFKVLKRSEENERNRELAAEVGKTFTAELHKVYHANCIAWMDRAVAEGLQFDVILTDPPYGMGADQFGDGGGKLVGIDHRYNDSYESWKELMTAWAPLSYAITKPEAHLYAFCDIDRFHEFKALLEKAGWYVHRTPLIDYKTDSGRVPLPDRGPRRQWEMILYAIKGNKTVTHIYPDVIPCQADPNMTHGAQKPVALYANLLKRSVRPGDHVLDTFAGSGTIFPACHSLQCVGTGVEQAPDAYGMCLTRLRELSTAADPLKELLA